MLDHLRHPTNTEEHQIPRLSCRPDGNRLALDWDPGFERASLLLLLLVRFAPVHSHLAAVNFSNFPVARLVDPIHSPQPHRANGWSENQFLDQVECALMVVVVLEHAVMSSVLLYLETQTWKTQVMT